ncbi:hypothetical protein [Methylobacterium radiotolerans]|uniref:hypothetical protein n=1 Tax=Methylobacterium radiotolerans TaxID=31998 RepID=UPI0038D1AFBC
MEEDHVVGGPHRQGAGEDLPETVEVDCIAGPGVDFLVADDPDEAHPREARRLHG